MKRISDINYRKILKLSVGSTISILMAQQFGLSSASSAGIITLLTVQNTKKETLRITLKRILAFAVAMILSSVLFLVFGFQVLVFGLFLLLFVWFCQMFSLDEAVTTNAVLVSHLLKEASISPATILNESLLLLIGAGIGIVMNLFLSRRLDEIRKKQRITDDGMIELLHCLKECLLMKRLDTGDNDFFDKQEKRLEDALKASYQSMNNTFDSDVTYFFNYMEMRKSQCAVLKNIHAAIVRLQGMVEQWKHDREIQADLPKQLYDVADLIDRMADSFHECNNAVGLIQYLEQLRIEFKKSALPVTRAEFESRAVLYQIIHDFSCFLELKKDFAEQLPERQKKLYWDREV